LIKDHADKLIVPEACIESFSKHVKREKISSFDGYKEDVYIADYLPDPHFKEKLPFDRYVVLRPEALASFYVQESKTLVPSILKNLKNAGINVVYLPRDKGDAKYAAGLDAYIPEKALNGLDLCYHSMGVLTGSGTMAREAACMGKTAISFFPGKTLLSVDEKLIEEGKMIHTRDPKAIVEHVISNIKPTQCIKLERCRNVKENVIRIIKESCHE
jgi:predicted glycosyltransferase